MNPLSVIPAQLERVGIGLFTIPKLLDQDFADTIRLLAEIGYKELEFFGPYSFSAPAAQERWAPIARALGMAGSGFFGHSAHAVKTLLDQHDLTAPSMHTDLLTLRSHMAALAEAAQIIGATYVVLPSIPEEMRPNLDAYRRIADEFNQIGVEASKQGVRFVYHNHGYGLMPMEGEIPLQLLLERTDPSFVDMELDIYWNSAGGGDPLAYLTDYPSRFRLMHIKDMTERITPPDDMNNSQAWMGLFSYIADAGAGIFDLNALIAQGLRSGTKHFFLERDLAPDAEGTLRRSYAHLAGLRFGEAS